MDAIQSMMKRVNSGICREASEATELAWLAICRATQPADACSPVTMTLRDFNIIRKYIGGFASSCGLVKPSIDVGTKGLQK